MWQAICSFGLYTKPYVLRGSLNKHLYIMECLEKRLLPLYKQHLTPPLFWPDLATIHYAKQTIDWFEDNNVKYVPKLCNPPNCPELRPMEKFCAQVKRILRKTSKVVVDEKNFITYWIKAVKKVGESDLQTLMRGLKTRVRKYVRMPIED